MKSSWFVLLTLFPVLLSYPSTTRGDRLYPPWSKPPSGGVEFTIPCVNNVPDLHGEIDSPDLVVFFGGNQFMVLPEIMEAFKQDYPQYQRIFYETLPPGILEKQIETGSLVIGNLKITHAPDLFVAGKERLEQLDDRFGYFEEIRPYYRNRLAMMIRQGNPKFFPMPCAI